MKIMTTPILTFSPKTALERRKQTELSIANVQTCDVASRVSDIFRGGGQDTDLLNKDRRNVTNRD